MKTETTKHDLTNADNITVSMMRRKSKDWLIASILYFQLRHKQDVTDHAMELNNLREHLDVEKKSAEYWKAEFNTQVGLTSSAKRDLKEAHNQITNQRQIIHKLGNSIADLGECIAHL